MMVEVNNVSFSYGKNQVLKKNSFYVKKNEIVAITGPSGGGKSTLLHLIAGLLSPIEGEILILGKENFTQKEHISYLLQEDLLLPWKTVLENLLLLPELRFKSRKGWEGKARILLEEMGLNAFMHHYPHELSGGMRQRVSLARALLLEPKILLLDEPFAAIDSFRKESLYKILKRVRENREMTILFVTHQIEDLAKLADRYYIMIEGEIQEEKTALKEEVSYSGELVDAIV